MAIAIYLFSSFLRVRFMSMARAARTHSFFLIRMIKKNRLLRARRLRFFALFWSVTVCCSGIFGRTYNDEEVYSDTMRVDAATGIAKKHSDRSMATVLLYYRVNFFTTESISVLQSQFLYYRCHCLLNLILQRAMTRKKQQVTVY